MRLDTVTAEIRPRSDWEAADLGFAMVRRSFWRCITVWWMAMTLPTAAAIFLLWDHPFIVVALFWWWKPAGSRMVLFELSRRLFGEEPSWKSVWKELPKSWCRRFFYRFFLARFSPWLPVTLAVEDLEGLRGKAYKQRCAQVVRRGESVVMWLYFVAEIASVVVAAGLLAMLLMFIPEGQDGAWQRALESWDPDARMDIPLLISRMVCGCVIAAMSFTDIFVIGSGFGIYINNRTWIEGWDVELAFRRLAQRLGKVALVVLSLLVIAFPARAQDSRPPSEVIGEVKKDPAFKVHTVKTRVPKSPSKGAIGGTRMPANFIQVMLYTFAISAIVLLLGFVIWIVWKNLHVFKVRGPKLEAPKFKPSARVVLGMEVSPDTLPGDVPSAAWALWQQGRHHEALGLLYRGSISRVIEAGRVEIQESDTEGDCMRRVEKAGAIAHPDYFRGITGMWIRRAYAGIDPADAEVQTLCQQWPFGQGGRI